MKKIVLILFVAAAPGWLAAQSPDSLMQAIRGSDKRPFAKILAARQQLASSFEAEDWPLVGGWLGFLQTELDTTERAATAFDERWLLYFWTENFGQFFSEVADYQHAYAVRLQYQNAPPEDSLFEKVDAYSFAHRFELFQKIQRAFLNEEERAAAALLLDHLLRTDDSDEGRRELDARAEAFLKKYPESRLRGYIFENVYDGETPSREGFMGDALFYYARHDHSLGINFNGQYALGLGLGYFSKPFTYTLRGQIGGMTVRRPFDYSTSRVVPDSSATVFDLGLEVGYSLLENSKLHIQPTLGFGWSHLCVMDEPPSFDFDSKSLNFNTLYWTFALNFDWKFKTEFPEGVDETGTFAGGTWASIRLRAGFKHLNFGSESKELVGSQIFIGAGVALLGRGSVKRMPK